MNAEEEKMSKMIQERLSTWKESQIGQTGGYEYERSFAEMMWQIEKDVFKEMTGTELGDKNKKKLF